MSKCCFCGKEIEYKVNGNDPRPIRVKGEEMPICCNECNARIVVPTRVAVWGMEKDLEAKLAESEKNKKSFKVMYFNKCLDYEHLHEKFDDKCAEFELKEYDYKQTIFEKGQDKINFAVELLEQVRQEIAVKDKIGLRLFIDGKIKEIRESK